MRGFLSVLDAILSCAHARQSHSMPCMSPRRSRNAPGVGRLAMSQMKALKRGVLRLFAAIGQRRLAYPINILYNGFGRKFFSCCLLRPAAHTCKSRHHHAGASMSADALVRDYLARLLRAAQRNDGRGMAGLLGQHYGGPRFAEAMCTVRGGAGSAACIVSATDAAHLRARARRLTCRRSVMPPWCPSSHRGWARTCRAWRTRRSAIPTPRLGRRKML